MSDPTPTVDAPSKPPERFRRTRIAVSVFFGLLTVALCVLWVRSYWRADVVRWQSARPFGVTLVRGLVQISIISKHVYTGWDDGWDWRSPLSDEVELTNPFNSRPNWYWGTDLHLDLTVVIFPIWAVALPFAIAAALIGYSPRFSLRTLLIATTLVAVLLGLGVWLSRLFFPV